MRILIMPRSLVFLVFLLPFCLNAQIFNGAESQISTNPAQYVFSGFNLRYAEMRGRYRMGLDLGFRPAYCNGCKINGSDGIAGSYRDQNFFNYSYTGITTGAFFDAFAKNKTSFLSLQPYYRYWWLNRKSLSYNNVEGYSFRGLRSETNRVLGLRLMAGSRYKLWKQPKTQATLDISIGPGLMYRWIRYTTLQGFIYSEPVRNYSEKDQGIVHPVLHFRLDFTITLLKEN